MIQTWIHWKQIQIDPMTWSVNGFKILPHLKPTSSFSFLLGFIVMFLNVGPFKSAPFSCRSGHIPRLFHSTFLKLQRPLSLLFLAAIPPGFSHSMHPSSETRAAPSQHVSKSSWVCISDPPSKSMGSPVWSIPESVTIFCEFGNFRCLGWLKFHITDILAWLYSLPDYIMWFIFWCVFKKCWKAP